MARRKGKVPFDEWVKAFKTTAEHCKQTADATGKRGRAWLDEYRKCMRENLKPKYEELKAKYTTA